MKIRSDIYKTIKILLFYESTSAQHLPVRQKSIPSKVGGLLAWMHKSCARLSKTAPVVTAKTYILRRPESFIRLIYDGRICLTNNAAQYRPGLESLAVRRFRSRRTTCD